MLSYDSAHEFSETARCFVTGYDEVKFPGAELVKKPARQTFRSIGEERLDKAGPSSRFLGSAAEER